jgi:DNA-binding GntR family transcriptional regulator
LPETINYGGVPTEIHRRLRDRILKGTVGVGEQIKIDAVAKEFGVSIIPVREAIRMLAADHLIDILPRRSPVVSGLSPAEVFEISKIRLALEPAALEEAIPQHTDESLQQCEKILELSKTIEDPWDMVELNREFHLSLYQPCGMDRMMKIISDQYDGLMRCAQFLVQRSADKDSTSVLEHTEILDACKSKSTKQAVAGLKSHLKAATSRLHRKLELDASLS